MLYTSRTLLIRLWVYDGAVRLISSATPLLVDTAIKSYPINVFPIASNLVNKGHQTSMNVATGKPTIYRISPLRLWLPPGIIMSFGILALALAIFDSSHPDTKLHTYFGLGLLAFALGMYLLIRHTRLVLSADGIKLHQFGWKLDTEWDNIAHLYDEPGAEGLVLHRPMSCQGAFKLAALRTTQIKGARMYSAEEIQFIGEHRFIPLTSFAYWIKKGQLRDDLARRAPGMTLLQRSDLVKTSPWY
jgi:hypothetical protein